MILAEGGLLIGIDRKDADNIATNHDRGTQTALQGWLSASGDVAKIQHRVRIPNGLLIWGYPTRKSLTAQKSEGQRKCAACSPTAVIPTSSSVFSSEHI